MIPKISVLDRNNRLDNPIILVGNICRTAIDIIFAESYPYDFAVGIA